MNYRFLFICGLLVSLTLSLHAQSKLTLKEHMMYTDVALSHNGATHNVQALIDTGASVCIIDSTFAADSCNIVSTESNVTIGNTSGKWIKSFDFNLDSLSLGRCTYPKIRCFVVDLAGKLQHLAPKFILGGDVLKRELWRFDLKGMTMTRCEAPIKNIQSMLKWKNHENYKDASLNSIYLKGKIAGKKTRIFFDTGSKRNKLPNDFGITATKEIEAESGDIANKLTMKKGGLCEDVCMELAGNKYLLDFTLNHDKYPRINLSFLYRKSFVLDYAHKHLYILE